MSKPIPEEHLLTIERWVMGRVPENLQDEYRLECQVGDYSVTIVERRPPWNSDMGSEWTALPIAQLRYKPAGSAARPWSLYWADRDSIWHRYSAASKPEVLLAAVDRDPYALFWG